MKSFNSLEAITPGEFASGSAVAIGKFDGVHRGHRALLEHVTQVATQRGLHAVAFTFLNNPLSVLNPFACPEPIMGVQQRLDALADEGVDACVMLPFDRAFAELSASAFVEQVLIEKLQTRHLCVGPDFRFGRGGVGDLPLLASFGERHGFTLEIMPVVQDEALGRVSSSRIREQILSGDVVAAARMMDRPVEVRGEVVRGDARGRELGFPTANLGGEVEGLVPAEGVYAGWVTHGGNRTHAAISVGNNPTFTPDAAPRVEAHLIDFDGDLYGERISVQFAERLRGTLTFTNIDELIEQMHQDVREARVLLTGR